MLLISSRAQGSPAIRPTVLITKSLAKSAIEALEGHFDVVSLVGATDPDALIAAHSSNIQAIAGGNVQAELMARLPALEIIANSGVGVDSIHLPTARARNIAVTNTPDVLNDSVAELAIALMLALARSIPQADRFVRDGKWTQGLYPLQSELRGKTAGIIGLGRIGKGIAHRLVAMQMTVAYWGRHEQADQPFRYFADPVEMAQACDWVVVIAPGGETTKNIVSRDLLAALGPKGRLVNVARGSLVDQDALIEALKNGTIGGAALDVFASEPDIPADLVGLDNVVLSPHQGSRTQEAREGMGRLLVDNLVAHFEGRPLPSRVA